ncbi:MAG: TonB family protein [Deltaproteobacteria bacterium]|nr:TonB family protein [Deltaproteobacteria bacterium]
MGSLPRDVIQRVIRRNIASVRRCYEQLLLERPDAAGRVTVRFVIGNAGAVQSATVSQSTLGHAETERCVEGAVRRMTFPAPEGGVVTVVYPFVFSPSG